MMFSQRGSCQNLMFLTKRTVFSVIVDVCQIGFCQKLMLNSIRLDKNKTLVKNFIPKYQFIQGCLLYFWFYNVPEFSKTS